ncbi:MAG TPA: FKBP-type peptidyl-prolyl cis-trans isomerase [Acidimicrobiales bacterium]
MGTEKRERQKSARQAKIEQEEAAARRQRRVRTVRNVAIAAVVVLGGAFAYSSLAGDDDEPDEATEAEESDEATEAEETDETSGYSDPELAAEVLEREPPTPEPPSAETAADALEVSTLIEGEGDPGTADDGYVVHYVGVQADGATLDESWSRGPYPIEGPLSQAQLIDGWKEGLVGAKIGERRRLVIGADKAYGDGPLAFEIDVVDIIRSEPSTDATDETTTTTAVSSTETTAPAG